MLNASRYQEKSGMDMMVTSGLLNARYYDPNIGRFISPDPAMVNPANPITFNRYAYANDNPYRYTDPTGMKSDHDHDSDHSNDKSKSDSKSSSSSSYGPPTMSQLDHMTPNTMNNMIGGVLGAGIEDAAAKAISPVSKFVGRVFGKVFGKAGGVRNISPGDLEITHARTMSRRAFGSLKEDMSTNGIKNPVSYVVHDGKNFIVDGNHRVVAARSLGMKSVPSQEVSLPHGGYNTPEDLHYDG